MFTGSAPLFSTLHAFMTAQSASVNAERTSGSQDFKRFVDNALVNMNWNPSGPIENDEFGIATLKRFFGFLLSEARSESVNNFEPTKTVLLQLHQRLLGPSSFADIKTDLVTSLAAAVNSLMITWPPTTPEPPLAVQNVVFWTQLADETVDDEQDDASSGDSLPAHYPSVLLQLDSFPGAPHEILEKLRLEVGALEDLEPAQLNVLRPSIALTFNTLAKRPIPESIASEVVQRAAVNYLNKQIKTMQTAESKRAE